MPLQGKKPFIRLKPPSDLKPNEELFYCKITHEVFREYEQFFDRVILCNSLIWSCALTGKPGLTFQEAIESEKNARNALKKFPEILNKPLLFLATLTARGRINDLCDDVYAFVKERYFVGEEVEVTLNGVKKTATVTKIVSNDPGTPVHSDEKVVRKPKNISPDKLKYEVQDKGNGKTAIVKGQCISRVKGTYTKANNKLFLRHHVISKDGVFRVKPDTIEKHDIKSFNFKTAFSGSLPKYACSPTKKKPAAVERKKKINSPSAETSSPSGRKSSQSKLNFKKSAVEKAKLALEKSQLEFEQQRLILIEQKQKRKDEYKRLLEEKKQMAKEQKLKEREKKKEEQKKVAEYLNSWKQFRDDLECDDLKDLPKPVPIKCSIPQQLFGDAVAVLEFVTAFSNFLRTRDFFHHGFSFQHLENALKETAVNGLFNDLLQLLLGALLRSLPECFTKVSPKDIQSEPEANTGKYINVANIAYCWPHTHLGCYLKSIPLDSFSLTEVLRLSILRSGTSYNNNSFSRGLNGLTEDPGYVFRIKEVEIMDKLAHISVFQFTLEERLRVVMLLIEQLNCTNVLYQIFDKELLEGMQVLKAKLTQLRVKDNKKGDQASDSFKKENGEAAEESDKIEGSKLDETADADGKINTAEEKAKQNDDLSQFKADNERRRHVVKLQIEKLQSSYQCMPMGRDRGFRRYWFFNSLPGIFVEDDDSYIGPCLPKVTLQLPPNAAAICRADGSAGSIKQYLEECKNGNSDKENDILQDLAIIQNDFSIPLKSRKLSDINTRVDTKKCPIDGVSEDCLQRNEVKEDSGGFNMKPTSMYGLCTADIDTCPIHNLSAPRTKWSFFYDKEDINSLLQSLNPRGIREGPLRKYILNRKEKIFRSLYNCPYTSLNTEATPVDQRKSLRKIQVRKSANGDLGPDLAIELSLRNMIVELEQKIFDGGLGYLRVKDRVAWIDSIQEDTSLSASEEDSKPQDDDKRHAEVVKDLSQALLELSQGIESKYIGQPLMLGKGLSSDGSPLLSNWQASVLKCTSLSQIYIHLGALDRSILWTKSAHKAKCKTCRRNTDPDKLLLCDECNRGYHLYCLRPPLKKIPQGDWFCLACEDNKKPNYKEWSESGEESSANQEESGGDDDEDEEEDEEVSEVEVEDENDDEGSEDEEAFVEEVCETCQKPGTVICCDDCPKVYHPQCIGLRRIPRGDWSCPDCQKKEQRSGQKTNGAKSRSASSTPSDERRTSKRQADARPKIHIKAAKRKRDEIYEYDSDFTSPASKKRRSEAWEKNAENENPFKKVYKDSAVNMTRRRSKSSGAIDMLDYKTCLDMLVVLMRHPSGWPFLVPVNKKDAPDYHQIIKCPMDFGTIKSNLNNMIYKTNDDYLRDVYLVLQNCELFNPRSSVEYKAGQTMHKELQKLLKTHALSHSFTADMLAPQT